MKNNTRTIVAIDPGNVQSGMVVMGGITALPISLGKIDNKDLLKKITDLCNRNIIYPRDSIAVIEMVAHYGSGMPAGASVFDTCVWIGRFIQALKAENIPVYTLKRQAVKLNLCGQARAKDSNVTQALIDRFAKGQPNHGKGTKKDKGWFYGFKKDIWQAYALGVTAIDLGIEKLEEQE